MGEETSLTNLIAQLMSMWTLKKIFLLLTHNKRLRMWAPNATEGENRAYIGDYLVNTVSGNSKHQDEIYVSMGASLMKYARNSSPFHGSYLGSATRST